MYDITFTEQMLPVCPTNHETPRLFDVPRLTDDRRAFGQLDAHMPAESAAHLAVRPAHRRRVRTELLVAYGQLTQDRAEHRVTVGRGALDEQRGRGRDRQLVGAEADIQPDADDDAGVDALGQDAGQLALADQHVVRP